MKLVDTSVLVEIDRGNDMDKIERLQKQGNHAICQISVTELFTGLEILHDRDTDRYYEKKENLEKLLSRFRTIKLDKNILVSAAKIIADRKEDGKPVDDLNDTYIAATALERNLELLTKNPSDFEDIEELEVKSWEEF